MCLRLNLEKKPGFFAGVGFNVGSGSGGGVGFCFVLLDNSYFSSLLIISVSFNSISSLFIFVKLYLYNLSALLLRILPLIYKIVLIYFNWSLPSIKL